LSQRGFLFWGLASFKIEPGAPEQAIRYRVKPTHLAHVRTLPIVLQTSKRRRKNCDAESKGDLHPLACDPPTRLCQPWKDLNLVLQRMASTLSRYLHAQTRKNADLQPRSTPRESFGEGGAQHTLLAAARSSRTFKISPVAYWKKSSHLYVSRHPAMHLSPGASTPRNGCTFAEGGV